MISVIVKNTKFSIIISPVYIISLTIKYSLLKDNIYLYLKFIFKIHRKEDLFLCVINLKYFNKQKIFYLSYPKLYRNFEMVFCGFSNIKEIYFKKIFISLNGKKENYKTQFLHKCLFLWTLKSCILVLALHQEFNFKLNL